MTDTQTWRKRNACERCRKQKVRCEYDSVSVRRCVRCIRTNSECTVLDRNGKRSEHSPESAPQPIVKHNYDPGLSAIKLIVRDGFYDIQECATFYEMFTSSGQYIPACDHPVTLCELSSRYPLTSLALVTVVALSTSTKRAQERLDVVKHLMMTASDQAGAISIDSQSAFLLLTEYLLPFFEKGIMRLSLAHGAMSALQQRHGFVCPKSCDYGPIPTNKSTTGQIARLYEFTANSLMSVSFMRYFAPVNDLAQLYCDVDKLTHPVHSLYMSQVYKIYTEAITMIRGSSSVVEVWDICIRATGQIETLPDPVPKYVACGYMARGLLVSISMSWSVSVLQCTNLDPWLGLIEGAVQLLREFAQMFTKINVTIFPMPIWWAYMACHSLTLLWSMRLYAFSVGLNIDIPLDEVRLIVGSKWKELLTTSFVGRQNYIAWLMSLDAVRFSFGLYDETQQRVVGPGSLAQFFVYRVHETGTPMSSEPLTRQGLWALTQDSAWESMQEPPQSEFEPEGIVALLPRHIRNITPGLRY